MKNKMVRLAIMESGKKQWEIARDVGMSETGFSRKLRDELPVEEQERIVALIRAQGQEVNT